ncbi:acyl carrier protein [Paraburkholderia sp.]|uniref:acyl carrier protein n=1 Tax=Paraburkholderia sp. TaxID=1926495 RepID=UPI0023957901|nr:acyl carrier protein [Paraburkholderia sp.]MDE1184507.1 acyl carrier protein [Paraburkholderia sp.]
MLQLPMTPIPAPTGAALPATAFASPSAAPSTALLADEAGPTPSLVERLLTHAQTLQDTSAQTLNTRFGQIGTGRMSTVDMLRLQGEMGTFAVQVQMTVRIADEVGRAIQTLSQRN